MAQEEPQQRHDPKRCRESEPKHGMMDVAAISHYVAVIERSDSRAVPAQPRVYGYGIWKVCSLSGL